MINLESDESKTNLEFLRSRKIVENLSSESRFNYFWVGCSDFGITESEVTGLPQSEFFVHTNLANLVLPTDINCLSAMQMAVDIHKVENIIVCGHYDCRALRAALVPNNISLSPDLAGNWLRPVGKIAVKYKKILSAIKNESQLLNCLCELNVIEQAVNVCRATPVTDAWKRGQVLTVHGLIYNPRDGLVRDLNLSVTEETEISEKYEAAIENLKRRWMETDERTGGNYSHSKQSS